MSRFEGRSDSPSRTGDSQARWRSHPAHPAHSQRATPPVTSRSPRSTTAGGRHERWRSIACSMFRFAGVPGRLGASCTSMAWPSPPVGAPEVPPPPGGPSHGAGVPSPARQASGRMRTTPFSPGAALRSDRPKHLGSHFAARCHLYTYYPRLVNGHRERIPAGGSRSLPGRRAGQRIKPGAMLAAQVSGGEPAAGEGVFIGPARDCRGC
jgi:hypothetical protein